MIRKKLKDDPAKRALAEKTAAYIKEATDLLGPIVKMIETSPPATKNHYGRYLAVLSEAPDFESKKKLAAVLILAGANKQGVIKALKLS